MNQIKEEDKLLGAKINIQEALYFTMHQSMGIPWTFGWFCGSRGRGKSFATVDSYLSLRKKYGAENCKCFYLRQSDLSVKSMLANKGLKAIPIELQRKYNLDLTVKNDVLYDHGKPLMTFYALVSAAKKGKGINDYDSDFLNNRPLGKNGKPIKRFIWIIIDEFQVDEKNEKKSVGNPVEQFKIYIENILRDQRRLDYQAVRIIGCANAVSECSDFLSQLHGFIPEKFGLFKLTRQHAIIYNIPNNQAYLDKRSKSYTSDIMDYKNDANYTNVVERDLQILAPKNFQKNCPSYIIMFQKDPQHWFTVWKGGVISRYSKQNCKRRVAMRRYLNIDYSPELVAEIIAKHDVRGWLFTDLISQATFAAELKQIKPK